MRLKSIFIWIGSTLAWGGGTALFLAIVMQPWMGSPQWISLLLTGLTLGAIAELGFFSYLIFNWLVRGLIRSQKALQVLLLFLVILVTGNFVYLLWEKYNLTYLVIPAYLVIAALVVAWFKVKATQLTAWIPTLFFLIVVTTLESIPSINPKDVSVPLYLVFFTVTILLVCNAWQILRLHKWIGQKKTEKS